MNIIRALLVESCIKSTLHISDFLSNHSIDIDFAYHGISALELIIKNEYDIIILDSAISKLDALSLTQKLRQQLFSSIPIILLSSNDQLGHKVKSFRAGVDDYIQRPFACEELLCRIQAITKRGPLRGIGQQKIGDLHVNYNASTISRGDTEVELHQVQMRIVKVLAHHYPNTVSRQMLEQEIWSGTLPESSPLRTHIYRLRQTLIRQLGRNIISTVYAKGYKLT